MEQVKSVLSTSHAYLDNTRVSNPGQACEGDIVSAVFIILDLNEKSGWTERNAKREFYAHAHTIVGSEKSLRHALDIIRKTLAEAKRIRVKMLDLGRCLAIGRLSCRVDTRPA